MTFTEDLLPVLAVALLPGLPLWALAWCAWTGRYRRWAIGLGTNYYSFQNRNYFPLVLGVVGTAWAVTILFIHYSASTPGHQSELPVLGPTWGATFVLLLWWPNFLTPRWYKEWIKRSGGKSLDPSYLWPPDEWREIQKRERTKRQAKAERKREKRRAKSGK